MVAICGGHIQRVHPTRLCIRNPVFFGEPLPKIDQTATLAAKGAPFRPGIPGNRFAAGRAVYDQRGILFAITHQIRQIFREKGISLTAWVGCSQSLFSMIRTQNLCLFPLMTA